MDNLPIDFHQSFAVPSASFKSKPRPAQADRFGEIFEKLEDRYWVIGTQERRTAPQVRPPGESVAPGQRDPGGFAVRHRIVSTDGSSAKTVPGRELENSLLFPARRILIPWSFCALHSARVRLVQSNVIDSGVGARTERPKVEKFPAFFPDTREFVVENGSPESVESHLSGQKWYASGSLRRLSFAALLHQACSQHLTYRFVPGRFPLQCRRSTSGNRWPGRGFQES
jgi:hypothetical protein